MQYNYVLLNEGFYRWLETNYLPIGSQILFLKLIHLFNLSAWSEWLAVDNQRMMSLVQTKREQSVIEWRDKLLENDLIVYVKGKKGLPNKYKLNDKLAFICEAKSGVNGVVKSVVNSGVKSVAQSVAIDKQNKTKQNKKENTANAVSKKQFGEFENVFLSEQEFDKLQTRFGEEANSYIERLSNYIASSGKRYKSHYATILTWAEKDKKNEKLGGGNYANKGHSHSKKLCTEYPE